MGAMSPLAAGAAAGAGASQPQAGAAFTQLGAAAPQVGAACEQLLHLLPQDDLQHLLQAKMRSSRQGLQHFDLQPLLQPLLQLGAAAQVGPAAAQVGAAAAQVGAAAAQVGAAAPQDGAAAPQVGAACEQLLQPLPQAGLQHFLQLKIRSKRQAFLQHLLPQPLLQPLLQLGAAAQVGPAAAHVGAAAAQVGAAAAHVGAAAPQDGAAAPHEGAALEQLLQPFPQADLQQRTFTHFTLQQEVSQQLLSQPQPLEPSIRSSSSNPKLWVQAARPSTNDPTKMFNFIERRLLNAGTNELAHVPVRPDT